MKALCEFGGKAPNPRRVRATIFLKLRKSGVRIYLVPTGSA
jgi:hypothetical protein